LETMAEKKLYEGMFLVDSAKAASDWDGINATIKRILDKAKAEIVSMRKWDDRRLAYDIRGVSRGTYLLCYFRADGGQIQSIEKAVQLSEKIIRVLILNTDQMTQEDIDKETPATKAEKEKEKAVAEQTQATEEGNRDEPEQAPSAEEALVTEEVPMIEEAQTTEQAQEAESVEQVEETEDLKETEKTSGAGRAEGIETEEPQDSQPKIVSDD
jgi:small subunit ribosomal protein S6